MHALPTLCEPSYSRSRHILPRQAGARFADSLLRALSGESVTECTFVYSDACPGVEYFATEVKLGKDGIEEIMPIGKVSEYEQKCIDKCIDELKGNIEKGVNFANQ